MIDSVARLQRKRENGEDGFTLIELLVVVVIIGVLIAIAVPLYLNYRQGANDKAAQSDVRGAISAIEQCNADTGAYPVAGANNRPTDCTVGVSESTDQFEYTTADGVYRVWAHSTAGNDDQFYCYSSETSTSVDDRPTAPGDDSTDC